MNYLNSSTMGTCLDIRYGFGSKQLKSRDCEWLQKVHASSSHSVWKLVGSFMQKLDPVPGRLSWYRISSQNAAVFWVRHYALLYFRVVSWNVNRSVRIRNFWFRNLVQNLQLCSVLIVDAVLLYSSITWTQICTSEQKLMIKQEKLHTHRSTWRSAVRILFVPIVARVICLSETSRTKNLATSLWKKVTNLLWSNWGDLLWITRAWYKVTHWRDAQLH